jgi:hypothetical protein
VKRPRIKKSELFRMVFGKKGLEGRIEALVVALSGLKVISVYDAVARLTLERAICQDLNQAAPVAIDLGNGPIACASFGSAQNGKVSYRPLYRRPDCTALVGGINLSDIKSITLF